MLIWTRVCTRVESTSCAFDRMQNQLTTWVIVLFRCCVSRCEHQSAWVMPLAFSHAFPQQGAAFIERYIWYGGGEQEVRRGGWRPTHCAPNLISTQILPPTPTTSGTAHVPQRGGDLQVTITIPVWIAIRQLCVRLELSTHSPTFSASTLGARVRFLFDLIMPCTV